MNRPIAAAATSRTTPARRSGVEPEPEAGALGAWDGDGAAVAMAASLGAADAAAEAAALADGVATGALASVRRV